MSNNCNVCHKFIQSRLFISGGEESTSAESITQGDPTAMPIYALGSLPLLNITTTDSTKHTAYADDMSCVRKLRNVLTLWNKLNTFGSKMRYFPKAEKYEAAKGIFKDTNLNITNEGKRHLGAVVGTEEFVKEYVIMRVNEWVVELKLLSKIRRENMQ